MGGYKRVTRSRSRVYQTQRYFLIQSNLLEQPQYESFSTSKQISRIEERTYKNHMEELVAAIQQIKVGQAPAPEKIMIIALKEIAKIVPEVVLSIYYELLKKQEFLTLWKKANALKAGVETDQNENSKMWPICLLDAAANYSRDS